MNRLVVVPVEELSVCIEFARELAANASQPMAQFYGAGRRTEQEQMADTVCGKLAEVAFQIFCRTELSVDAVLDFILYDDLATHDQGSDIALIRQADRFIQPALKLDVKGNTGSAQWLLVEDAKFGSEWAECYVMTAIRALVSGGGRRPVPRIADLRRDLSSLADAAVEIEIIGFAMREDFHRPTASGLDAWFEYKAGQRLIRPNALPKREERGSPSDIRELRQRLTNSDYIGPALDAPLNYGLPIKWLRRSDEAWQALAERIKRGQEYSLQAHDKLEQLPLRLVMAGPRS